MRRRITQADRNIVEEWKWMGTVVKLTFARSASLKDPAALFNSSLDGRVRRAIDIHEGQTVDAAAFKALVREAVAVNRSRTAKTSKKNAKG